MDRVNNFVESEPATECISILTSNMNTSSTIPDQFESTYALIVRSEEKQRSRFETLIYTLLVGSSLFALTQFGREAATLPSTVARNSMAPTAILGHRA